MIKVFCAFMKVRWQFPVSNFLRNFGDTTPSQKTWILNVEPFWKIKADLSNVSLKIESYDPNQYVNGDRLSIQVESSVDCEGLHSKFSVFVSVCITKYLKLVICVSQVVQTLKFFIQVLFYTINRQINCLKFRLYW